MISLFGNIFLLLSLFFTLFQFLNSRKKFNYLTINRNKLAVNFLLLSSLSTFFVLIYGYIISDFSILNVFQNSHTSKPLIYKISAVWGNHEGSMLLWILVLSFFNFFIFKLYRKENSIFVTKTLEVQSLIMLGFILFVVITSNPFQSVFPTPQNGLGFNPILQDPALAIHPPLLYIGYVGFSAVFSLSIATLSLKNIKNVPWYKYMKIFVIISWSFLTIGIAFGSIWAYYELGWGGWWFWDPVENASFMPWLLGTALMHSLISVEKKKALIKWVLILAMLTFLLSVIGTFLVRSGILTSVHAFALDPSRGIYILAFVAFMGIYAFIIFSNNSKKFLDNEKIIFLSKEGSILINNILMIIVCGTVFLGTVYPLIFETFSNNKISVGEPYYNSTVIPIIIPAILVMGIGPFLSWKKNNFKNIKKNTILSLIISVLLTFFTIYFYRTNNIYGFIGIFLSFWIISNVIINLIYNLDLPKGMALSHFGFGLLILGITASSVWQEEKIIRMKVNDEIKINDYKIKFKDIKEKRGKNYIALQGEFNIQGNKKKAIKVLKPENRFYPVTKNSTTEASIHVSILRDLYIVLGDGSKKNGWVVRVYYNPLVSWIWIGAFTIFLGGLISFRKHLNIKRRFLI